LSGFWHFVSYTLTDEARVTYEAWRKEQES
jgi:hypothetical protein